MLLRAVTLVGFAVSASCAHAQTSKDIAELFEKVRAELPCTAAIEKIALNNKFALSTTETSDPNMLYRDFVNTDGKVYVAVSDEVVNGVRKSAVSISQYDTSIDFATEVDVAFGAIWDLPNGTPNRDTSSLVDFEWVENFPNGRVRVVISHDQNLTQIYGLMSNLTQEQLIRCRS